MYIEDYHKRYFHHYVSVVAVVVENMLLLIKLEKIVVDYLMVVVDDLNYFDYLLMDNKMNYYHFLKDFIEIKSNLNKKCEHNTCNWS
jgi:hypothetical protein